MNGHRHDCNCNKPRGRPNPEKSAEAHNNLDFDKCYTTKVVCSLPAESNSS